MKTRQFFLATALSAGLLLPLRAQTGTYPGNPDPTDPPRLYDYLKTLTDQNGLITHIYTPLQDAEARPPEYYITRNDKGEMTGTGLRYTFPDMVYHLHFMHDDDGNYMAIEEVRALDADETLLTNYPTRIGLTLRDVDVLLERQSEKLVRDPYIGKALLQGTGGTLKGQPFTLVP